MRRDGTTPGARLLVAVSVLAAAGKVSGQDPDPVLRAHDIAIEVTDQAGRPAGSLAASDLRVFDDGEERPVLDLTPLEPGAWRLLVYVDAFTASPKEVDAAAEVLGAAAGELVALGEVTLVVADDFAEPWLERETAEEPVAEAFAELAAARFRKPRPEAGEAADFFAWRRRLLLDALVGAADGGPGGLVLVGDPNGEKVDATRAAAGDGERGGLAATVGALGWVALPLHAGDHTAVALISPLAEETGGRVVSGETFLQGVRALGGRFRLRFVAPVGEAGRIAPLHVEAGQGRVVRAPRWLAHASPDAVVLARARRFAVQGEDGRLEVTGAADLDADASGEQMLAAEVLVSPAGGRWAEPSSAALRVSFAMERLDETPLVLHHAGRGASLAGAAAWLLQARLPASEDLRSVVVLAEDLATGDYGVSELELGAASLGILGSEVVTETADLRQVPGETDAGGTPAAASLIRILPPRATEVTGTETFRAMALNAFIDRVVFYLDGAQVDEDSRRPFVGRIDVGPQARTREVKVVAYDRQGRAMGEDTLVVNPRSPGFSVAVSEVRAAPASGELEVTADVTLPPDGTLRRVEFWWNESLGATRTQPPFRARLEASPSGSGADFVRVVAFLDDGRSLEDVRLFGVTGPLEQVDVNLVEIFAVVTDRGGEPVRDLSREEFTVRLGGQPVEIERFGLAEDIPLALGLVIDTSESMGPLIDQTKLAAARFLGELVSERDRSFLVDFDTEPRLAQGMTADLADLMRSLRSLRPGGNTALYDAILFSLLHFEAGEDRRAVVLLTDGDDYKSRFSARQAWLQARAHGVPVYMISLAGMDWLRRSLPKGDLEQIARQTGGEVFYVSAPEELGPAYARIGAELRSQYVLAFPTPTKLAEKELDKLQVRVVRPGLEVRAVVAGRSIQTR